MSKTGSSSGRSARICSRSDAVAVGVHGVVLGHHDAVARGALGGDQPAPDLQRDQLGVALERVAPAATAPGHEVQHVAGATTGTSWHFEGSTSRVPSARSTHLVPRAPGWPPFTPHG